MLNQEGDLPAFAEGFKRIMDRRNDVIAKIRAEHSDWTDAQVYQAADDGVFPFYTQADVDRLKP